MTHYWPIRGQDTGQWPMRRRNKERCKVTQIAESRALISPVNIGFGAGHKIRGDSDVTGQSSQQLWNSQVSSQTDEDAKLNVLTLVHASIELQNNRIIKSTVGLSLLRGKMFIQVCLVYLWGNSYLFAYLSVPSRCAGVCNCSGGHIQCTFCTMQVSKCHFCLLNFPSSHGLSHFLNFLTLHYCCNALETMTICQNIQEHRPLVRECDLRRCGWGSGQGWVRVWGNTWSLFVTLLTLLHSPHSLSPPPVLSVMSLVTTCRPSNAPPSLTTCIIITGPNMVHWIPSIKMQSCCFRVLITFYGIFDSWGDAFFV